MPKKSVKKSKTRDISLKLTLIVLGSFFLFVGIFTYLKVQGQDPSCAANAISCTKDLSGKKEATNEGTFMGRTVTAPTQPDKSTYALEEMKNVLGESADHKRIYVDLTNQRLYAFEGNNKVYDFPVSTGKWGSTPTGTYRIWTWLRYTRMAGGSQALGTYYNLPNVPFTMYFHRGYGIHGAYWHNNFGHPMSHGCVNMRIEDAGKIFYWSNPNAGNVAYPTASNPGTLVTVYGITPRE